MEIVCQQSLPLEISSLSPRYTSSPLPCIEEMESESTSSSLSSSPESLLITPTPVPEPSPNIPNSQWFDYKLVGDNIDKTVRPRHETLKHHNQSLHYFQSYAVRDRVDLGLFSDELPQADPSTFSPELLLPSQEDLDCMLKNFTILVTRVLVKYMPCFQKFTAKIVQHIPHKFSAEMTKKSQVVSHMLRLLLLCGYNI